MTEQGKTVKIVEPELVADKKECVKGQSILHITEFKYGGANPVVILGDIRNKVGEIGANVGTTRVTLKGGGFASDSDMIAIGTRIPVETYKCPGDVWTGLPGIE